MILKQLKSQENRTKSQDRRTKRQDKRQKTNSTVFSITIWKCIENLRDKKNVCSYLIIFAFKINSDGFTLSEAVTKTKISYGKRIERTDFAQRKLLAMVQ